MTNRSMPLRSVRVICKQSTKHAIQTQLVGSDQHEMVRLLEYRPRSSTKPGQTLEGKTPRNGDPNKPPWFGHNILEYVSLQHTKNEARRGGKANNGPRSANGFGSVIAVEDELGGRPLVPKHQIRQAAPRHACGLMIPIHSIATQPDGPSGLRFGS